MNQIISKYLQKFDIQIKILEKTDLNMKGDQSQAPNVPNEITIDYPTHF